MGENNPLLNELFTQISGVLRSVRKVDLSGVKFLNQDRVTNPRNYLDVLEKVETALIDRQRHYEAEAVRRVSEHSVESKEQGGSGIDPSQPLDSESLKKVIACLEGWLQALSSAEISRRLRQPLPTKLPGRSPMNLAEKILAHHTIDQLPPRGVKPGDVIRIAVDWIIASELSWFGMSKTLSQLDDFKIWRNDRFWLAGDHVVDPRTYETPLNRRLIEASEKAALEFKLTDYKGANYTIMHTEFVRERAEPGLLVLGGDSHTCSSGAVGCVAIGLGAVDVAMALATGESWIKVPECISIRFVGKPGLGIGGKDIILYILGELKRNTVAAERIVEFSGPGAQHLSIDARFAISNMCTEFGAITGIFVPDALVKGYVGSRKQKSRRSSSLYFQPDPDCTYAESFEIDLSKIQSHMAIYPSPDDVVPISQNLGMALDGCFIGACTTTQEDFILAALVLQVGLRKGLEIAPGKKHVVAGSLPIKDRLNKLGLLDVYMEAGFVIGAPGCSFCVGMGADQAQEGEVWLSSQNRNFKNRMGKGSIGNLASAPAVAASSFSMTVTDPTEFLEEVDMKLYDELRKPTKRNKTSHLPSAPLTYVEPSFEVVPQTRTEEHSISPAPATIQTRDKMADPQSSQGTLRDTSICSKVIRLGDFIDTDAIAPAESLVTAITDEDLGKHCMKYAMPNFREKVRGGQRVVVGGHAFGVGSSREAAVRALNGLGVQCVIARSFAFIYGRNQPNLGLLGITITDDAFYEAANDEVDISISLEDRVVKIADLKFNFLLTDMELSLIQSQGMVEAYKQFGTGLFHALAGQDQYSIPKTKKVADIELPDALVDLQW